MTDLTEIFTLGFQDFANFFFYVTLANLIISQTYGISLVRSGFYIGNFLWNKISPVRYYMYTTWLVASIAVKFFFLKLRMKFVNSPPQDKPQITIHPIGRNHLKINYTYKNQEYSLITMTRRGPSSHGVVKCGEEDVSEKIKAFAGPGEDYHGIRYTPRMLGFEEPLTFIDLLGEETVYEIDDPIVKVY